MLNLLSILDQKASQSPEKLAYIFLKNRENQEQTITYQQLSQISKRIAARLQSLIPPGAIALLLYPQGLEFIAAFLGCLSAGIIAVPAYPPKRNQKISRLIAIIEDSQPQIILTTSFLLENIQPKLENFLDLSVTQFLATDNLNDDQDFEFHLPEISGDTLAFLQYTSGSTGSPKGVMISHDNIANNSVYIQKAFELTEKSVSVTWLPSFHDMGLIDGIIQPLYTGFLGIVMSPESFLKNPMLWLQAITKYRATHSGSPNLGYELCVRRITPEQQKSLDLSSWLSAYNGAEPIRRKTLDNFSDKFQSSGFKSQYFYPCYGMAEATLMISGGNIEDEPVYLNVQSESLKNNQIVEAEKDSENYQELVGCGHAWQDMEVKIVDPESCLECGENQVGEIWIFGSSIAQGYWHQEEQTIATFQAKLANTTDERNFLGTGDQPVSLEKYKEQNQIMIENRAYLSQKIAEYKRQPNNGLISQLANQKDQVNTLTEDEIVSTCILLSATAQESTKGLVSNALLALLKHPQSLEYVRQNPDNIKNIVEELLRYDSPIQYVSRRAMEDVEVSGKIIHRGEYVVIYIGAVNHDPEYFSRPQQLDFSRRKPNLAFGGGIHYCLGMFLAKLEVQIALNALMQRLPDICLNTDKLDWYESNISRRLKTLPVKFTPIY